ncbi:MAG: DUF1697 domain-containing protein [Saprospiraceae bacterium]|nr:DUF1697 domain-containing protein [Saprospiraceae bacterium]
MNNQPSTIPTTWIVLLRGINVGGRNILPMQDLRALLTGLGYQNIRTYIQSGNVVLLSPSRPDEEAIGTAIEKQFGFRPAVLILSAEDLQDATASNPYPADAGKAVHFYFCDQAPASIDHALLTDLKSDSESYELVGTVFYLYAPDGIGRSKLAAKVEKALPGVSLTGRNLNTVNKLLGMVADC